MELLEHLREASQANAEARERRQRDETEAQVYMRNVGGVSPGWSRDHRARVRETVDTRTPKRTTRRPCPHGDRYRGGPDADGGARCSECRRESARAWRERQRAAKGVSKT